MRKNIIYFLLAMMASACGGNNTSESENDSTAVLEEGITPVAAVCVWDNLSVRAIPSDKGKWLTSLSLGESITLLNETVVDSTSERTYTKVQLTDGNEGWSLADFIVADGEAATFIQDADVYSRPDLLTKTNKQYSRMDIVAIKSTQDGWLEVVGKRKDGRYIETNWVKSDNLSTEDVDIAVAKFAAPIAKMDDLDKKEMKEYAHICGRTLAQTHARSDDDTGIMEGDAEKRILSSIIPEVFIDDVVRFSEMAGKRVYKDYKLFKKDLKLGAFQFLHGA